ncbi:MAG: hypothetical protein Q7S61_01395 [bacterium]|nr:hypothetical protein [bacterium]
MKSQKGQVLLIIVMLLATAITVVLSITFKATTDIQLSKLEEENQKALAAAEAGIEEALQKNVGETVALGGLPGLSGFVGDATVTTAVSNTFVSPLLQIDQQYTLYLSDYPNFTNPLSGDTSIWYGSEGTTCDSMAIEVTYIYLDTTSGTYKMKRYLADSGSKLGSGGTDKLSVTSINSALDTTTFQCKTQNLTVPTVGSESPTVLIVRTLFAATRLGFKREDVGNLKPQGKYVTSEAMNTNTRVTKKIQLFQSYPQLPMEFFITSF